MLFRSDYYSEWDSVNKKLYWWKIAPSYSNCEFIYLYLFKSGGYYGGLSYYPYYYTVHSGVSGYPNNPSSGKYEFDTVAYGIPSGTYTILIYPYNSTYGFGSYILPGNGPTTITI